jgi:TolB protein
MPSWSPGGEWIAYRALRADEGDGVFLVAAGGGETRRITSGSGVNDPLAWSPDSKQIALAMEFENANTDIAIIDAAGSLIRRVTSADEADRSPSWSRDGREIVFCSDRTGRDEIWSVDIATGAETRITTDGGNTYPALSPSGDRIAWVSDRDGLVILDRASGRRVKAGLAREVRFTPSWSPDGTLIAVTAEGTGGSLQVYLVTSAGDTTLRLTKSTAGNGMPDWSPDGTQLVAVRNEGGGYGLWVFSGLGSYVERLYSEYPIVTFDVDG